jgi:1-deoxy-D-xylulose-5-phosphate reductoisomerase
MVLNAIVGSVGLHASLQALKSSKDLALANKESLVAGGPLFQPLLEQSGGRVLPIDSEHSAIWQALNCGKREEIKNLILTASGGPFRNLPKDKLADVTVKQALEHPTWDMGPKITIDSATLANKGLEVIEAVMLFSVPVDQIKVVIHPQSIIHSMVEFVDSSILAQLSMPDMRLPITYALFWPDRVDSDYGRVDWNKMKDLTFEEPDLEKFPMLSLAYEAARQGGTAPAIFNAANEVAVKEFLAEHIRYTAIAELVKRTMEQIETRAKPELDDILDADRQAREICRKNAENI